MFSEPVIRVSGLSKQYFIYEKPINRLKQAIFRKTKHYSRAVMAVENVNFEVHSGETVGIIGRNGCGKSTLLQMICGTLVPTNGSFEVKGRVAALLELGAGFNPEFTGRENIFMVLSLYGLSREESQQRIPRILAFSEIGDYFDQPVKTYSSGMYVRLAFSVIAHVDADIIIVDEALAVGDVFFVQKCMRFLKEFKTKGTLLFVSHDSSAVMSLCNRAIWMDAGKVRQSGESKSVVEAYLATGYPKSAGPKPAPETSTKPREEGAFGVGSAMLERVTLSVENRPIQLLQGGEHARLEVVVGGIDTEIIEPIVGFFVKTRLGEPLFGENTCEQPLASLKPGTGYRFEFRFVMPKLQRGDYTVTVAIGSGDCDKPVIHHWIHDALAFRAEPGERLSGIFAVPMSRIECKEIPGEVPDA